LLLNRRHFADHPQDLGATVFHELMHPLRTRGPRAYQEAVRNLVASRTSGDELEQLADGTWVKRDRWLIPEAGRVYDSERQRPAGREVPAVYGAFLTYPPEILARLWDLPGQREVFESVLAIFYGGVR
jgi:hypothetical protein